MKLKLNAIFYTFTVFLILLCSCGGTPEEIGETQAAQSSETSSHRNIILIIIDTLRADHLSCYGYNRNTSPVLDSLAESGTLWLNAQAQAPWTLPTHATIWTGLSARSHRTNMEIFWNDGERSGKNNYSLDTDLPSLPVLLSEAGFTTFGLANVILLNETHGFNEGFQYYSCNDAGHGRAAVSVDSLIIWLEQHSDERFFCMLHLFDVHAPYNPPPQYRELYGEYSIEETTSWLIEDGVLLNPQDRDQLVSYYDGEITWVDDNLGRLFSWMRENGLSNNTLVVLTADHGEEFLEHGWVDHGHTLYQELVHIPLIFTGPGINAGVVDSRVAGQYDILPTLLTWAGISHSFVFDGTDILSQDFNGFRAVPASGVLPTAFLDSSHLASVVSGNIKTIAMEGLEEFVNFDLSEDPEELDPLAADSAGVENVLYYWATPQKGFPELVVHDESEINTLKDLGYIN